MSAVDILLVGTLYASEITDTFIRKAHPIMNTNNDPNTDRATRRKNTGSTYVPPVHEHPRQISWGAIFAGVVVAAALTILLGLLGAGIGLWSVEPGGEADSISGMAAGTVIYSVIAQLVALFAGGYVASRMSSNFDKQNAMLHGVTVWGLAAIFSVWLTVSVAGAFVNTAFSAVKNSAAAVASATEAIVPDDLPSISIPELEMEDLPQGIQQTLREEGITPENFRAEAREAFRNVFSKEEQQEAHSVLMETARQIIREPGDAMVEIDAAIDDLFGEGGVISQEDRQELLAVLENRFGISEQEAESTIQTWQDSAIAAYRQSKQAVVDATEEAIDMGDAATDALGTASFWSFIGMLLGLGAAIFGAGAGRRERPSSQRVA